VLFLAKVNISLKTKHLESLGRRTKLSHQQTSSQKSRFKGQWCPKQRPISTTSKRVCTSETDQKSVTLLPHYQPRKTTIPMLSAVS